MCSTIWKALSAGGLALAAVAAVTRLPVKAQGPPPVLKKATFPAAIFTDNGPPPHWDKGFLIVRTYDKSPDPAAFQAALYDATGRRVSAIKVWPAGAERVEVYDVAVANTSGDTVVSALAWSAGAQMATMLCFVNKAGVPTRVVRTNPFAAKRLCVAQDGSVWGFGVDAENPHRDHDVLRRYSAEGLLLGSYMPKSSFHILVEPTTISSSLGGAFLETSADRVVAYSPRARQWIEFSLSGQLLGRWTVPLPTAASDGKPMGVDYLALTASDAVFAWLRGRGEAGLYELDRSGPRWMRVPGDPLTPAWFDPVIGAEGDDLIVWARHSGSGPGTYEWFRVAPRFPVQVSHASAE